MGTTATTFADDLGAWWLQAATTRSAETYRAELSAGAWIYGAGGYGLALQRLMEERGLRCLGFVDRRAADPGFRPGTALPVLAPDDVRDEHAAGRLLVVGVFNHLTDPGPIRDFAAAHAFRDVLWPAELPDILGPGAGAYWLTHRRHALDHVDRLSALIERLADRESADIVAAIARFRVGADPAAHPACDIERQYNPPDLPLPPGPVAFVDGGAFVGDTYQALVRQGVAIAEWYAFEPDLQNFAGLSAAAMEARGGRAALFPCGLGASCRTVRFGSGRGAASHAADSGESSIGIVALDEVLFGVRPTFVKLDVEGAEAEALDGMRRMIAACRPRLAVSLYHKPADLWELPFKVLDLMPDARLYVRQHGFNGFDTVLYAVP